MSVTKTDSGKWNARFPVGGGNYSNKVFPKKKQAEEHEAKMTALVRGGGSFDPKSAKMTIEAVAWEWYELLPDTPHYRQNTKSHIKNHLVPALGVRQFGTLTDADLQRLVNKMAAGDKPLVATSVRTVMGTVNMIVRYAMRRRILTEDPTIDLKLPPVPRKKIEPLHIEHVHLIAENIFPRYKAVVLFAAASGLRQGEVFGLRVSDITWEPGEGSVSVADQVQSYTGRPQARTGDTKSKVDRDVPLNDATLNMLRAYLKEYPPVDGYLFTNTVGKPLHRRVFDRAFAAARRRAALRLRDLADEQHQDDAVELALAYARAELVREAVFHGLRHFYASLLIRQGLSPVAVAARLGHKDPALTLRRYAHLWPDDEGRTRTAVDVLFVPSLLGSPMSALSEASTDAESAAASIID